LPFPTPATLEARRFCDLRLTEGVHGKSVKYEFLQLLPTHPSCREPAIPDEECTNQYIVSKYQTQKLALVLRMSIAAELWNRVGGLDYITQPPLNFRVSSCTALIGKSAVGK
jgi:hypothetical protein